jgi:arginase
MDWNNLNIVISNWELGAGKKGSSSGPDALIKELQNEIGLPTVPRRIDHQDMVTGEKECAFLKNGKALLQHQNSLAEQIENTPLDVPHTLILSGDHSNAIGGVSGFCRNKNPENIGIVWIDAHLDLHSPYTTPSGNIHGMSMNCILEIDNLENKRNDLDSDSLQVWEELKSLKNTRAVPSQNIVFIGIRSFEEEELDLIHRHHIKVIYADQIQNHGIQWAIDEAAAHLRNKCTDWYISFDVDSLDPEISEGTGTPEPGGLKKDQAISLLQFFWKHPNTQILEITEINPSLDLEKPMAKEMCKLLRSVTT